MGNIIKINLYVEMKKRNKNKLELKKAQHPNVFLTAQAVKKWLLHSNRILPL